MRRWSTIGCFLLTVLRDESTVLRDDKYRNALNHFLKLSAVTSLQYVWRGFKVLRMAIVLYCHDPMKYSDFPTKLKSDKIYCRCLKSFYEEHASRVGEETIEIVRHARVKVNFFSSASSKETGEGEQERRLAFGGIPYFAEYYKAILNGPTAADVTDTGGVWSADYLADLHHASMKYDYDPTNERQIPGFGVCLSRILHRSKNARNSG